MSLHAMPTLHYHAHLLHSDNESVGSHHSVREVSISQSTKIKRVILYLACRHLLKYAYIIHNAA